MQYVLILSLTGVSCSIKEGFSALALRYLANRGCNHFQSWRRGKTFKAVRMGLALR